MSLNPDAVEERAHRARAGLWRLAGPWWLMLVTGIAWLIISVMVLRFRLSSITTVGVLIGVLFLLAMFNEFLLASVRPGWRWAHVLLGTRLGAGAAAHLPGHARHHFLNHGQGRQQHLVARPGGRHP